jgi:hypothetical protein
VNVVKAFAHVPTAHIPPADFLRQWPNRLRLGRMFGTACWWSVKPNWAELTRRGDAIEVAALGRLDVVAALLSLPLNVPVAESALSARELRLMERLPPSVVDRVEGAVTRRAAPPLQVDHVIVQASVLQRGLEATSDFSTYCGRSIVLPSSVEVTELQLAEANYYGVGVYAAQSDRLTELVAPEPMPNWPETPASWVFSETLCAQLCQAD